MAPERPAYDDDWVWSEQSNVHVANHPDWFVSFTCFETHTTSATNLKVLGIGDVELVLRTKLELKGQNKIGIGLATIVLRDVLYAPDAASNIVGSSLLADYDLSGTFRNTTIVDTESREVLGLLDYCGRKKLLLERQRPGKRNLRLDCAPHFSVQWSEDERELWDAHKLFREKSPKAGANDHIPPLKQQEKKWVKLNYGGKWEDNFAGLKTLLNSYGLLLTDAKDRQTGCLLVRTLMSKTGYQGAKLKLSTLPPFSASEKLWVATTHCNEGNVFELLVLEESQHRHREVCRLCVRASIDTEEGLQAMLSSTKDLTPAEGLWVVREFRSEEKLLRLLKLDQTCDRHIGVCRLYVRISAEYGGGEEELPSSDKLVAQSSGKKTAVHRCSDEELMTWEQLCDVVAPYAHGVCFSKAQRTWIMDRYDIVTNFLEVHHLQVDNLANRAEAAAKVRRLMKRQRTVPMPVPEHPTVEADAEETQPTKPSFRQRMLERQGWSAGQGLGAAGKGITEPLTAWKSAPWDKRGVGIRATSEDEKTQRKAYINRESEANCLGQEGYNNATLPVSHAIPTLNKRGCTQEDIAQDQLASPLDEVEPESLEDKDAVVGANTRVGSADKHDG
ncbi:hypothetical protein LTS10_013002 [Elasticomyces elasticus]|nr:hypothetical protein LTS10_013002 [Elasticomyces elasticus]